MLEAAIALQLTLGVYVEAVVIAALLFFNAILGFVQEGRASAALAALKKRLAPTALVRRDGAWVRLPAAEVVPGGESVPVEGGPGDLLYAASLVRHGQAVAEATATGSKTYFGRAAEFVRTAHAASIEQVAIFSATRNLAVVNGIIAVSIVAYAYIIALPTAYLLRLGLTALLATIPVALPATFTLSAALAVQILASITFEGTEIHGRFKSPVGEGTETRQEADGDAGADDGPHAEPACYTAGIRESRADRPTDRLAGPVRGCRRRQRSRVLLAPCRA
jgi:H+-transporting ATPase